MGYLPWTECHVFRRYTSVTTFEVAMQVIGDSNDITEVYSNDIIIATDSVGSGFWILCSKRNVMR